MTDVGTVCIVAFDVDEEALNLYKCTPYLPPKVCITCSITAVTVHVLL